MNHLMNISFIHSHLMLSQTSFFASFRKVTDKQGHHILKMIVIEGNYKTWIVAEKSPDYSPA